MKKKKLLKRIEYLERENNKLNNKYEQLLYTDDRSLILMMRLVYENNKKLEQSFLNSLACGALDLNNQVYCKPCDITLFFKTSYIIEHYRYE